MAPFTCCEPDHICVSATDACVGIGPWSAPASVPASSVVDTLTVFASSQVALDGQDADAQVLELAPDAVVRAWTQWGRYGVGAADYNAAYIADCHARGIRVFGGASATALHRAQAAEAGLSLDDVATLDAGLSVVEHGPSNPTGLDVDTADLLFYRLTLANPKARALVVGLAQLQVDAGVDGMTFSDLNAGYQGTTAVPYDEGFDKYHRADFNAYLMSLYPVGTNLADVLGIPLGDGLRRDVFPGDLTANFDFARFLRNKGWQADPFAHSYPLGKAWGQAVMGRPEPGAPTFVDGAEAYRYWPAIAGAVRAYARDRYGRELLMAADGVYPAVDVHSVALRDDNVDGPEKTVVTYVHLTSDEHLDGMYSFQNAFLRLKARGATFAPGAPVVAYLDGFWNKYNFLPASEQADYWRMYSAEAYASGIFLAFHLKGVPGSGAPLTVAPPVMAAYKSLADFYRAHAAMYHGVVPSATPLPPLPRVTVAIADRLGGAAGAVLQRYVHIVNHQYSRAFLPQSNLAVTFASPSRPAAITLASPDQPADLAAFPFTYDELAAATTVVLPSLVSYTVIDVLY